MKQFLIKILIFVALVIGVLVAAVKLPPRNQILYNYEYVKKIARLDTLPSPRLVLLGGSNAAFSIDSKMLSDSLDINVVNTGLIASNGLKVMIDDALKYARPGDVIAIFPEYTQFSNLFYGEGVGISSCMVYKGLDAVKEMDIRQLISAVENVGCFAKSNIVASQSGPGIYSAANFDEYGDEVVHRQCPPGKYVKPIKHKMEIVPATVEYFAETVGKMKKKGATVVVLPPVATIGHCETNKEYAAMVYNALAAAGVPFQAAPAAYAQPDSLAYDTPYHLSAAGLHNATLALIPILRPYIPADKSLPH